jgi:8-oxo-dGTP pyrophosphatase MutT (NUDIX family)
MQSGPVPAVRLIVVDDEGRVLLLKRHPETYAGGGWCLPGGKIEYGQSVAEAIASELAEETGLEAIDSTFLRLQDRLPEKPGVMHCLNLYFLTTARGSVELNRESVAHAWVAAADLDSYEVVFGNREVLEEYWGGSRATGD